jgi:hypothetical protein
VPASRPARRRLFGLVAAGLLLLAGAAGASGQTAKKPARANDPIACPWCKNDPLLMKAAGIVSHGGFAFGKTDTMRVDAQLSSTDIRWIETDSFRIGFALGTQKLKIDEKKKMLAELSRLALVLPEVKPETTVLDPWLRVHLYAQRCEDIRTRFLDLIQGHELEFADGSGTFVGAYKGEGPFLGQKDKYEVLMLPSETLQTQFLLEHAGLPLKVSHRWHNLERGALGIYCHQQQGDLRQDAGMHGHVAFNLAHNLFDGLYHYSYDTPVWLHEGLAHLFEREINERHNSFDSGEGAVAEMTKKANWKPEVMRLISSGDAPRMAELMAIKSYAELKLPHHYVTWSMLDYLSKSNPDGLAAFLRAIKLNLDERGVPTGANLPEWHRKCFREHLGLGFAEFDEAWRAWVLLNYKPTAPKGGDPANPMLPFGGQGANPLGNGAGSGQDED